jgi:hypothetical protein
MRLLQKDSPFIWDVIAQRSFDDLKHALTNTLLLHPPNYVRDYIVYLVFYASTISMVLVQEDDDGAEHVIYYLSKSLSGLELRYSHVGKLVLVAVIVVRRFKNYILICTTTVIVDLTPTYHIFTRQVLGRKYSKWVIILQEFDLEFTKSKENKSLFFVELIGNLPHTNEDTQPSDSFPHESLFLISTYDPCYGDIILYLQTQCF